jgi:hypothetical protein
MTRPGNSTGLQSAPRWIVLFTGAYLVVGLIALYLWHAVSQMSMQLSSSGTESLAVVGMAVAETWLCALVMRSFPRGAPLRTAWLLILLSAAARAVCGVLTHVWDTAQPLVWIERTVSGPLQTALFGAGVLVALRVLWKAGFPARPGIADWALTAAIAAAFLAGRATGGDDAVSLLQDAVLCAVFLEALLLWRSVARMGRGLVAKCWGSFAIAIFVTVLGEATLGLLVRYAPAWPMAGFAWYTSFLGAAALALAPAYQVAAQRRAVQGGTRKTAGSPAERPLMPATNP